MDKWTPSYDEHLDIVIRWAAALDLNLQTLLDYVSCDPKTDNMTDIEAANFLNLRHICDCVPQDSFAVLADIADDMRKLVYEEIEQEAKTGQPRPIRRKQQPKPRIADEAWRDDMAALRRWINFASENLDALEQYVQGLDEHMMAPFEIDTTMDIRRAFSVLPQDSVGRLAVIADDMRKLANGEGA